ncbi:unnamed protein product [Blepharisma stoltei]|uniref:Uncharacterized protein n=1 Tax=Blepharisma stoltei TaxID=1481888 RepID=A0AAU9JV23_9CILI|nr:unnamed protein product [Blepharisma stoltei]
MDKNTRNFLTVDEKYKYTSVGCLVDYLKAHGHTPIEALIDHVNSVRHLMTTSKGKAFTKSAFEIVDHALSWNPTIFKLDDQFRYFLNDQEASKHEHHFKVEKQQNTNYLRKRAEIIKERLDKRNENKKRMERIKNQIVNDLKGPAENYSVMTKAYLILISNDKDRAESLKRTIRETYIALIKP